MTTRQHSIGRFRAARHRPLLVANFAVVLSMSLLPLQVSAQLDAGMEAALRDCTEISRDRARLACFDRVFAGPDATARDVADAGAASQPQVSTEPNQNNVLPQITDAPSAIGESARETVTSVEPNETIAEEAPPSPPDASESTLVSVVEVQTNRAGRATFVMADGAVWVQTDSYRRRYPAVPFDAEIDAASMGSFFLKVPGGARAVRVARRD